MRLLRWAFSARLPCCRFRTQKRYALLLSMVGFGLLMVVSMPDGLLLNGQLSEEQRKLAELSSVLGVLRRWNVSLVALEPRWWRGENATLDGVSVLTLGVFEQDAEKLQQFELWRDLRPKWWLTEAVGTDFRLMAPKESQSTYSSVVTHYFFVSSTLVLHLPVVFRRSNYFWLAGLEDSLLPPHYRYLTNLTYDIPLPMAVEEFQCSASVIFDEFKVCEPADLQFYLWQLPHARFLECQFERVVWPFKRQYTMQELSTIPQHEALAEVFRIGKELRIPIVIIFGTLLGWYRQCDYIVESMDMDTAVMSDEFRPELFETVFRSPVLNVFKRLGHADMGLEFRTNTVRWVWLDIFLLYQGGWNVSNAFMYNAKYWMKSVYPLKNGTCSADLLGVLVYLPCNYWDFIHAEYGDDGWFAPQGGHPHRNMVIDRIFDDTDVPFLDYSYQNKNCSNPNYLWGCDPMPESVLNSTLYQNLTNNQLIF